MLDTLRFSLQSTVYFIMLLFFWFMYYSHFTYSMCENLNVKLGCQKVVKYSFLSQTVPVLRNATLVTRGEQLY
jgi:hypothetical protein